MKTKTSFFSFVLLLCFAYTETKATHMMGSDISWKCIGKDSFSVTLVIYRDCNGVPLGTPSIPVRDASTGNTVTVLRISKPTPIDITPTYGCSRCTSLSCSFPYGIEQYTFTKMVYVGMADSICELKLSYQECCRNYAITTIASNLSSGINFAIEAIMNRCLDTFNSSPWFQNIPLQILCVGQDYIYNNAVMGLHYDSFGCLTDSLAYEWTEPITSSTPDSVIYINPYSHVNPIYYFGFPNPGLALPKGFHLDPVSGDITFRPMNIEQTVMALKVKHYRRFNGKMMLLNEIRRDLQFIVISCPIRPSYFVTGPYITTVNAGEPVSFDIHLNEPDTSNNIKITALHNIPEANFYSEYNFRQNNIGHFYWQTNKNLASTYPYVFYVNVENNFSPLKLFTSRAFQIYVVEGNTTNIPDKTQFSVFPNPALDQFTIVSSKAMNKIIIYNLSGEQIRNYDISDQKEYILKRNNLPSGYYLLKIFDNNGEMNVSQVVFK